MEPIKTPNKIELGKYEDLLINKVKIESMHERFLKQLSFMKNMRDLASVYCDSCVEYSNKNPLKYIKLSRKDPLDKLTMGLNDTNILIHSYIYNQKTIYENLAQSIKEEIISKIPKDSVDKNEKELFNKSKSILKDYNNMKNNLQKVKTEYNNYFKTLEKMYRDNEENKVDKSKNESKIKKTIDYLKNTYKKYHDLIKEINKKKEEKINNEKKLLDFYQKSDIILFNSLNEKVWKFVGLITKVNESNIKLMNELIEIYRKIDINEDTKDFINGYSNVKSQEEFFVYEPYIPEAKLDTEKVATDEKECEALNINYRIIAELKKDFHDICPNINMEEENEKCKLRDITQKLFDPKVKVNNEEFNKVISWLPNKKFRKFIIVTFSNQRTKGRYERSGRVVFSLGKILNQILSLAEKDKNYEEAKHCIILSQTFYSISKITKKKFYLFEYIKNNKWLKSFEFWDSITDCMIEIEIESNNKVLGQEALDKETSDQRRERQSQVCISQLLTFSENMIDFGFSKEEIDKIIKRKIEKFEIIEKFVQIINEHIDKTLAEKQKNKDFVEEDEISHYVKIRRNSMKMIKKPISIDNIIFNDNKEIENNKKIRKEKSVKYSMKLKLERNIIIQNIKKEIILDKKDYLKISNNKSESTSKSNFVKNKLDIKNNIDIEINKSYNLSVGIKRNIDNNEIIVNDKNEIIEEKEINEEDKKEEGIIKEEDIKENIINEEPIKKEHEEENKIEPKEKPNNEENKIENVEKKPINEEQKKENDVEPPLQGNENNNKEHIEEKPINEEHKKENVIEPHTNEENKIENIKEQPINEEHKNEPVEVQPINEENKKENNIVPSVTSPINEENKNEENKEEHVQEPPKIEEHKEENPINDENKNQTVQEHQINEENKNENNVEQPVNNEENKNEKEKEELKIEDKKEENK